jgi:hypothetical protein
LVEGLDILPRAICISRAFIQQPSRFDIQQCLGDTSRHLQQEQQPEQSEQTRDIVNDNNTNDERASNQNQNNDTHKHHDILTPQDTSGVGIVFVAWGTDLARQLFPIGGSFAIRIIRYTSILQQQQPEQQQPEQQQQQQQPEAQGSVGTQPVLH